jgi:hypothetical protein
MMAKQLHGHIAHRSEEIQGLVNKTIQSYCTDGSIEKLVDAEVRRALDASVKDTIDRYFTYGKGRTYIDKQVESALSEVLK